jgi:hypothetical protein
VEGGTVTFKGGSSITFTTVRFAQHTRALHALTTHAPACCHRHAQANIYTQARTSKHIHKLYYTSAAIRTHADPTTRTHTNARTPALTHTHTHARLHTVTRTYAARTQIVWRVQAMRNGGVMSMAGGTATFTGGSSITGGLAVRFAQTHRRACMRTQARTHAPENTTAHTHARARTSKTTQDCEYRQAKQTHTRTHTHTHTRNYTDTRARARTHTHTNTNWPRLARANTHAQAHIRAHTQI